MLPLPIRTRMRATANWKDVLSRSARRYCSRKHCFCMHDIICVHKLFYCSPIASSHCAACRSKWCPLHAPWKIKYNNFACKRRYMMHLLSCHIYALFTCMHNVVYSFVWPLCTHILFTHKVVHTHKHTQVSRKEPCFVRGLISDVGGHEWFTVIQQKGGTCSTLVWYEHDGTCSTLLRYTYGSHCVVLIHHCGAILMICWCTVSINSCRAMYTFVVLY